MLDTSFSGFVIPSSMKPQIIHELQLAISLLNDSFSSTKFPAFQPIRNFRKPDNGGPRVTLTETVVNMKPMGIVTKTHGHNLCRQGKALFQNTNVPRYRTRIVRWKNRTRGM